MANTTIDYLLGKYVLNDTGSSYRTGMVIAVMNTTVVIQFDLMKGGSGSDLMLPMELVCLERLTHELDENDNTTWGFFENREQLNTYVGWLNGDDKPPNPIVRLVPKKG